MSKNEIIERFWEVIATITPIGTDGFTYYNYNGDSFIKMNWNECRIYLTIESIYKIFPEFDGNVFRVYDIESIIYSEIEEHLKIKFKKKLTRGYVNFQFRYPHDLPQI